MLEKDIIQAAYETELMRMFNIFVDNLVVMGTDSACQTFSAGIEKIKQARDLALKLVEGIPV